MEDITLAGFEELEEIQIVLQRLDQIQIDRKESESVKVWNGLERVTAKKIVSKVNIPPFDRAAMDGYAVKSLDVQTASPTTPRSLEIIGRLDAGVEPKKKISSGETIQINTGAKLPAGADAIVRVEDTEKRGSYVQIFNPAHVGHDVSEKGEDIKKSQSILPKGKKLTPYDLALLTSLQEITINVVKKPHIGVLACGDELINPREVNGEGNLPQPGKIIESNGIMIQGLIQRVGATPVNKGIVPDAKKKIRDKIKEIIPNIDLLVTIGGTSVGSKDLLPDTIKSLENATLHAHGVKAMPGKPILLSTIGGTPVISLPGYPVSAGIDFLLFAQPVIKKLLGRKEMKPISKIPATLSRRVASKPGMVHFVRVSLEERGEKFYAKPIRVHGAGIMSSLVEADGFLVIPKDLEGFESGDTVPIIQTRDFSGELFTSAFSVF